MLPSIDWWITSRCNFACDYCYGPEPGKDPGWLREDILGAIRASSACAVTFCGGEPLLVRDIGKYARQLKDAGKTTVLNTNGSMLLRRMDQGLDFAFDVVGLSLDGSCAEVHQAMRGLSADFDEVLRAAAEIAGRPGTSLKLATVVSQVNLADLPCLAQLVRSLRPDVWRLYQYSPRGAVNTGQRRHELRDDSFRDVTAVVARQAAPVRVAASPESVTAGCLIIDPEGNLIQPLSDGYRRLGNCLCEPINDIWTRATFAETVQQNKHWLSVLAQ
ncbi:radical SAM protein [Trebonia sp.]|uniref:radical SAM protein n=1 Tax=Trebonia sp. TaxID=2767075 RepID=UPI0026104397|nr:radical SAM protein [Trebonia sp.]